MKLDALIDNLDNLVSTSGVTLPKGGIGPTYIRQPQESRVSVDGSRRDRSRNDHDDIGGCVSRECTLIFIVVRRPNAA